MKVHIKNYQAIKDAKLEFLPGITVIVGNSNNGKSSIIRAIESAINNKGGSSFINYDADECIVTIEDNGNKVIWTKSRKQGKSSYNLNGEELNKIGQKQLEEVGELLNMQEVYVNNEKIRLNFWKQLDFPFLVGKSPYQLFDFISRSKEQELILSFQETNETNLKDINKEISNINSNIDLRTKDISSIEDELKNLEKFNNFDTKTFELMLEMSSKIKQLFKTKDYYESSIKQTKNKLIEGKNMLITLEEKLTKVETIYNNLKAINKEREGLVNKLVNLKTIKENISKTELSIQALSTNKLEDNLNKLGPIISEYTKLLNINSSLKNLFNEEMITKENIKIIKEQLYTNKKIINNCITELNKFDNCPLCGQDLSKHTEVHQ